MPHTHTNTYVHAYNFLEEKVWGPQGRQVLGQQSDDFVYVHLCCAVIGVCPPSVSWSVFRSLVIKTKVAWLMCVCATVSA